MGKIRQMLMEDLTGAGVAPEDTEKAAKYMGERGYRRGRNAAWVKDKQYNSKKYVRWRCTGCGHFQAARKYDTSEMMFYMNYCPFCGAKMNKPPRKRRDKQ